ncbi:hypothetical protein [Pseudomonas fluorescens]|uniref:hypothetical protein n=1 Tax=Pseudomonas fluorescens TaxID=294 RepID=UPI001243040F|nr:hypothetical protein [Pseudomonas fluorescens]
MNKCLFSCFLLYLLLGLPSAAYSQVVYVEPMRLLSNNGKVEPDRKITKIFVSLMTKRGIQAQALDTPSAGAQSRGAYVVTGFVQKKPLFELPPCSLGLELIGAPEFSASLRKPDGTVTQLKDVSGDVRFEKNEVSCPSIKVNQAALEREVSKVLDKLVGEIKGAVESGK